MYRVPALKPIVGRRAVPDVDQPARLPRRAGDVQRTRGKRSVRSSGAPAATRECPAVRPGHSGPRLEVVLFAVRDRGDRTRQCHCQNYLSVTIATGRRRKRYRTHRRFPSFVRGLSTEMNLVHSLTVDSLFHTSSGSAAAFLLARIERRMIDKED